MVLLDQADFVHEPSEGSDRERTAAEAEEIQLIIVVVVVNDEPVEITDIGFNTFTEGTTGEAVESTARANPVVVIDDLVDAPFVARNDSACDFGYIRRVALLRLLIDLIADIPGAIGANGDAFHDTPRTYSSPEPSRGRRVVDALAAQVSRVAHTHERQQPLLEHWQPDIAHVEITVGDQLEQFSPVGDSHRDGEEEHLQFPHID